MAGRIHNAGRNVAFGVVLKIYQIVAPFLTRTLMIKFMCIEYTGLNGLFSSVLQVLNLAELGVGSAMIFSMYEPVAKKNSVKIRALMNAYRRYYKIIGAIIMAAGLLLVPFITLFVKDAGSSLDVNIYAIYILNLAATVTSYLLFAYKEAILLAHQRDDIISKINIASSTLLYALQIVSIVVFRNYYMFVAAVLISQIITNIVIKVVADRVYGDLKPSGRLDDADSKEIRVRIKDLFTAKIGGTIVNSADALVISIFLGLTPLAAYQNYFFIVSALNGIMGVVYRACLASIGNSIIVEDEAKNFRDFRKFTFLLFWVIGLSSALLACLYQPFIRLWVGDGLMLDLSVAICLALYFFVYQFNQLLCTYKDAAGIWHKDRYRPLITGLANLALNVLLVNIIGIYGVILSTVLSYVLVGTPWLVKNLFSTVFSWNNIRLYLRDVMCYCFMSLSVIALCLGICLAMPDMGELKTCCLSGLICFIIVNSIFFFVYRKTKVFSESKEVVKKLLRRK